jgi:hypothetical protein
MASHIERLDHTNGAEVSRALTLGALRLAWHAVRLPVLALLILLEPFVSIILVGTALLGLLAAVVFEVSGVAPHFHLGLVLAFSIGSMLVLMLYHTIMRLFS